MIIGDVTPRNFSLDGVLFFEVGLDLIVGAALQRLLVPTHVLPAQAILEFVSPDLQIGSGRTLKVIIRGTTAGHNKPRY